MKRWVALAGLGLALAYFTVAYLMIVPRQIERPACNAESERQSGDVCWNLPRW